MPERNAEPPASAVIWSWRTDRGDAPAAAARGARTRGAVRAGIGLLAAAALFSWKPALAIVAGSVALSLLAMALASPTGLYPRVERAVAAFARAVGVAVSWSALTLVFFLVVLPVGLLLRASGRLRLVRSPDPAAATYWRAPDTVGPAPGRHDRQF